MSKLFRCDVYFMTCNSNTILISFPVYVHKYTHHWNGLISAKYYNDVIMGAMASQITSLTIIYSTIYSGGDQRKHQSSVSLAFVRGITGEFPAHMASNAQNVSIWWRHYEYRIYNVFLGSARFLGWMPPFVFFGLLIVSCSLIKV